MQHRVACFIRLWLQLCQLSDLMLRPCIFWSRTWKSSRSTWKSENHNSYAWNRSYLLILQVIFADKQTSCTRLRVLGRKQELNPPFDQTTCCCNCLPTKYCLWLMSVLSLWRSWPSGWRREVASLRHSFRPLTRLDNGNSHTAVGGMTLVISRSPSSRCATHRTRTLTHHQTDRPFANSAALARRRVVIDVAYVPRPDWREAEISMIRAGRLAETDSTSCFFLSNSHLSCILISRVRRAARNGLCPWLPKCPQCIYAPNRPFPPAQRQRMQTLTQWGPLMAPASRPEQQPAGNNCTQFNSRAKQPYCTEHARMPEWHLSACMQKRSRQAGD